MAGCQRKINTTEKNQNEMSLDVKQNIDNAIKAFSKGKLNENALKFFAALGYNTERQAPLTKKSKEEFRDTFISSDKRFDETKARFAEWKYVDLLFQLSKEELTKQSSLFDTKQVDNTIIETYLFFAIELSKESYSRTELSLITREINRLFPMPVMILFKHGGTLTLSVINRRLHKRDESKDVLEKVTQIKDINITSPHRAHIEILFDLSFDELSKNYPFSNFVELHNAWQKTLDTKELNKKFFRELSNWYFAAMNEVSFPDDLEKKKEVRNATNLIRLITRVIFIWFIKEKQLVPASLFRKDFVAGILKDFNKNKKSQNYYNAILQNLFFGTLNQKMGERKFAKEGDYNAKKEEYGVKNLFRYADLFTIPEKEVLALFKDVPFLNGGLFDCLDKPNDDGKIEYVDGFSRNTKKQATVPDYIFFGEEKEVDLNDVYGTRNKHYRSKGLINLLESYKFTVAENTPLEEEIALDPELLGKVFENLLASYNPETQTTARKQTGSFYTPREIVNYMVDESLLEYIKQHVKNDSKDFESRLRDVFSYSENPNPFGEAETKDLIEAINHCKILDPACGSGAFPMGILHKMVHILQKLDPENKFWKELQRKKAIAETETAFKIGDKEERAKRLSEINDVFENNAGDYGRKLYLIENCIYGIDIQPIAVQIAKLRFFISLVVDQKVNKSKENFGVRSLPNLETKFVAANTLIGLDKPQQTLLRNPEIEVKENQLKALRHQYFTANTRKEKLTLQKQDKKLRLEIAKMLENDGWETKVAKQIVAFDPYDQNSSAAWFDAEWMFGLMSGFDIVIGNPPYKIMTRNNSDVKELNYFITNYKSIQSSYSKNIFTLFIENAFKILGNKSTLAFIVPEGLFKTRSYSGCVEVMDKNGFAQTIVTFTDYVFENAVTGNLVFIYSKNKKGVTQKYHFDENYSLHVLKEESKDLLKKIELRTVPLKSIAETFKGMVIKDRDSVLSENSKGKRNKFLFGKNISKWSINSEFYTNYSQLEIIGGTKRIEKHDKHPRILIRRTGDTLCCAFLNEKALTESTLYSCWSTSNEISTKEILGILNSKLLDYYNKNLFITNQQGFPQILMTDLELLPIKIPNKDFKKGFVSLIDKILSAKEKNPDADTIALEKQIDELVYKLYDLTEEEITIIENSNNKRKKK